MHADAGSPRTPVGAAVLVTTLLAVCSMSCEREGPEQDAPASAPAVHDAGRLGPPPRDPSPRQGMAWIEGGALVAGTRPEALPRIADEEMPGEQVILKGFYIDIFPYPNEEGALSLTHVDQAEAAGLCRVENKRLCSELEWERACKGPDNFVYEYGDRYSADWCGTGEEPRTLPHGLRVGCRSGFGVGDMHGGVWEWTGSPWGRGHSGRLVTLRGGNGADGELVGRCANARPSSPASKSRNVGFRCCAGARNEAEVALRMERGQVLARRESIDRKIANLLLDSGGDEIKEALGNGGRLNVERMWWWRPIANERLVVAGGCIDAGAPKSCGIVIGRRILNRCRALAAVSSGRWVPTLYIDKDARDLWVLGADARGRFRVRMQYSHGRVAAGSKDRRIPRLLPRKTKRKRKR